MLLGIVSPVGLVSGTGSALPMPPPHGCIGFVKWMAVFAMGLLGVASTRRAPPQQILAMCNRFHVGGVDATVIPAEVINLQTLRDRPYKQLIGHPVCSGVTPCHTAPADFAVTTDVFTSDPQPTGCAIPERAVLVDLRPEPLVEGHELSCRIKMHRESPFLGATREGGPNRRSRIIIP
jgi:hypothetical protein